LTLDELNHVSNDKGCSFQKRGNVIYHEGYRINGFYCVNRGVLKIYKTGIDLREQIVRFAQAGDIFGYRSVLSGDLACTTAEVIEDAVICFIPSTSLFELIKKNVNFAIDLMQITCRELKDANDYLADVAQKTVRERLAEVLLLLKETFKLDKDNYIQVSLTREELSNIVGTATESVIRLLSEFKTDKIIDLDKRRIKILDVNKLIKVANIYE